FWRQQGQLQEGHRRAVQAGADSDPRRPDRTELTTLQGRNHALETPARPAATLARLASAGVVRPIAGTGPGFVDCATGHPWRTPVRHPRAGLPGRLPGGAARAV